MKAGKSEPVVDSVVVAVLGVKFEEASEYYCGEKRVYLKDIILSCNTDGNILRAAYEGGFCGVGLWDKIFSKKTQRELKKIAKKETKKTLAKIPSKINLKKYGGWF